MRPLRIFLVLSLLAVLAVSLSHEANVVDALRQRPREQQKAAASDSVVLVRKKRAFGNILGMFRNMMSSLFGGGKKGGKKKPGRGRPSSGYGVPKGRPSNGYGAPRPPKRPPRPGYGAPPGPQGPPQRPGYGAPAAPSGGYGAPAQNDGYGAPQAPVVGGGGDSYGSPQAPAVSSVDSYGSPQAAPVTGGPLPPPSSYNAVRGSAAPSSFSTGSVMAPASLSNTVIKMLPAPNLATGRPNTFTASASSSSYNSPSTSFGAVARPAQDSYGSPTGPVINSFSSGDEVIVQATPTGANNPFITAALSGISSNSQQSSSSYGSSVSNTNSFSSFSPSPVQTGSFPAPAQQAADSYGSPQASPISTSYNSQPVTSTGFVAQNNPFPTNTQTFSNPAPVSSGFVPSAPAPDSYGIPQAGVVSSSPVFSNPSSFPAAAPAPNSYGSPQSPVFTNPAPASPAPASYGSPQGGVINNFNAIQNPNIVPRGNNNGNPFLNSAPAPAPATYNSGGTDFFGSPVAPVGTSAPVPEGIIPSEPTSFDTYNSGTSGNELGDAPVGEVVSTKVEGEQQPIPRTQTSPGSVGSAPNSHGTTSTSRGNRAFTNHEDAANNNNGLEPLDASSKDGDEDEDEELNPLFLNLRDLVQSDPSPFLDPSAPENVPSAPATNSPRAPPTDTTDQPAIEVDLVNGDGDVDLTNGVTNNDASVEVDLTNNNEDDEEGEAKEDGEDGVSDLDDLFPGYDDSYYDDDEYYYEDEEAEEQNNEAKEGRELQLTNDPRVDLGILGFDDLIGADRGRGDEATAREGKDSFQPATAEEPFFEYADSGDDAKDGDEDVEFISVPLKIEELSDGGDGLRGGDPTVILAGSPPDYDYDEDEAETTTTQRAFSEAGDETTTSSSAEEDEPEPVTVRGVLRAGLLRPKKRVEDIPPEAFHSFLVEPPQAEQNQKKRGIVDWSHRLREKKRRKIWRQFRLN